MQVSHTTPIQDEIPTWFKCEDVTLVRGDALEILGLMPPSSVDCVFADPPYRLSNDGISCHAGRIVSVNKGGWDRSQGVQQDHQFTLSWLAACRRVLKPNGTIWVSGTNHNIYSVGFAMQTLGFRILNDICWVKPNPAPNLSRRYFTHSHETLIWAARDQTSRHTFNYDEMRALNGGKQMRSVWQIGAPCISEKRFGKHPTQKPVALLQRLIRASTEPDQLVLDPFVGSGTTCLAARSTSRRSIGIDQSDEYLALARNRLEATLL